MKTDQNLDEVLADAIAIINNISQNLEQLIQLIQLTAKQNKAEKIDNDYPNW